MRKILLIAATGLLGLLPYAVPAQDLNTPVGTWRTIDDKTGKPKSIVEIFEVNGKLSGRIIEVFPEPGKPADPVCDHCTGSLQNKKIKGLVILWGFSKDDDVWDGGRIFDPEKGNDTLYKAKLTPTNGGQELSVRGYVGFSLLGRTQTWHRVK